MFSPDEDLVARGLTATACIVLAAIVGAAVVAFFGSGAWLAMR